MILLAPDKFKGSLTAQEVCQSMREGLAVIAPGTDIVSHPMADGGEGTADLLTQFSGGEKVNVTVLDPLFREIHSEYGLSSDGSTAFIEMAKASGLQLLDFKERNPLQTTTFGTGQLIADALNRKVSRIILGVGGSATNDAGMGMAEALGYRFLSSRNELLRPVGASLMEVETIQAFEPHPQLKTCELTAIYDVANPLYGKQGAAFVYAKQKGATREDIEELDRGLTHFAAAIKNQFQKEVNFDGAGAGGGLPAVAALIFSRARFERGIDFIIGFTNLEQYIERASLVITGEGKIDTQTMTGKVVKGVAQLCAKHRKPCVALAGTCDLPESEQKRLGLSKVITLVDRQTNEDRAMRDGFEILRSRIVQYLPELIHPLQN